MSMNSDWGYAIVWEFQVRPEAQPEFERVYGPRGEWAELFRSADGYQGTELIRDEANPRQYVTIDLWRSRRDYEAFRQQHADEYRRIEQRCEQMTEAERALGSFERVLW